MTDYDWSGIERRREHGEVWSSIADDYGVTPGTIRKAYSRYQGRAKDSPNGAGRETSLPSNIEVDGPAPVADGDAKPETDPVLLQVEDIERITTLEDLLAFFKVDPDVWAVDTFRVNKWESAAKIPGGDGAMKITPLYQVRANLRRNLERDIEIAQATLEQVVSDMQGHAISYTVPEWERDGRSLIPEPVMMEMALMDPHLAMLAWGEETGEDYDLKIALRDYEQAVDELLSFHRPYNVERVLFLVGNDMIHVDTIHEKVATTTRGTPQDFDSRLPKIFTAARRAAVDAIDKARTIAPVDVLVVPGNHDSATMYRLGDVLSAWYRNDDAVNVINTPRDRKYYQYGQNLLGFTHGDGPKRLRNQLPFIMADEAPRLWANTTYREVHCGHLHATSGTLHLSPSEELSESRGVRVRYLPGLTPQDAWHVSRGYRHTRASTVLVWKKDGGLAGLHEVHP